MERNRAQLRRITTTAHATVGAFAHRCAGDDVGNCSGATGSLVKVGVEEEVSGKSPISAAVAADGVRREGRLVTPSESSE